MKLIADIFLVAGSLGAAIYCYVLATRLKKFSTLESGMGGAIAVLSAQVDDMTKALDRAGSAAVGSATSLEMLNARSEAAAARLELLLASMHGLPEPAAQSDDSARSERKLRFVRHRMMRDDLEAVI